MFQSRTLNALLGGSLSASVLCYASVKLFKERKVVYCQTSEFSNKTVVITGAAGDIGHATARAFAKRGAHIVLVDLPVTRTKMETNSNLLLKEGAGNVLVLQTDMTKEEEVQKMVEDTVKAYGGIDCFFNNAGIQGELNPLHKQSVDTFKHTLLVNTVGVFLGMKYVSLAMIEAKKGGVIVNTSSLAGLLGAPNMTAYVASKFAVTGMTRTAAKDLAPHGIRVCGVAPGLLEGKMWESQVRGQVAVLQGKSKVDVSDDDFKRQEERMVGGVPLRRTGKLSEVAEVVVFLCSEAASYVTGEIITIDGGKRA